MTFFLLNILVALSWAALWGEISFATLSSGFLLGLLTLWFARSTVGFGDTRYFRVIGQSIVLFVYFCKELWLSSVKVARDAFSPKLDLKPTIVKMPLDVTSDLEIFLVANLISLTPGTLTLDVAPDRSFLVIHTIYGEDPEAVVAELKGGMEHRVKEVFKP